MDHEKAYIEVTEFLCTELKRIKSEKDLYKGMWEQAEEELRKLKEMESDVRGVQVDTL